LGGAEPFPTGLRAFSGASGSRVRYSSAVRVLNNEVVMAVILVGILAIFVMARDRARGQVGRTLKS